jgi:hypothetical protein
MVPVPFLFGQGRLLLYVTRTTTRHCPMSAIGTKQTSEWSAPLTVDIFREWN